jgi:hypothetical protein
MDICKILSYDYLHCLFLGVNYHEILKYEDHFLECPICFNKLLHSYFHYFSREIFDVDKTNKDVVFGISQDPEFDILINNNLERGGEIYYNEESFYEEEIIKNDISSPINISSGSLFVYFCKIANEAKSVNSIVMNGKISLPEEESPLRNIVMIFLRGFSNIKRIVMYNETKLFDIKGKVDFYQRYFKNTCCAFSQEEVQDGFIYYVQSSQNAERVILLNPQRLIGEIK